MADHADGNDIFVYRGGRAPRHVTHVRIDKSVEVIEEHVFDGYEDLVQVETHDGIRKVEASAFYGCKLLRGINLKSAVEISDHAFYCCGNLESVEFGDKLETIGRSAFGLCSSLKRLILPSIITFEAGAFWGCSALTDVDISERLETIESNAFLGCECLQRIAIPLKRDLLVYNHLRRNYTQFDGCELLVKVDLVGETHTKTVASLHMGSWSTEMQEEINRINQVLPTIADEKTDEIQQWMDSVLDKMDHYKAKHLRYVEEATTLLELSLWKAKLGAREDNYAEGRTKKAKVDVESARNGKRITCGADTVIKNVLPFLRLE
ncbi:leucine-rich repeat domain-containing protein [Skeletonema marinoi]|uniref:Leucine-rich repeat domain-containing protein n=1 Tax=Skeletonema marinoi TaxID=267567 RepID=A0AAD8Y3J8_9STRA|nr:leucine-rich repeat domain-containing protein [Skeletonema marinoi]